MATSIAHRELRNNSSSILRAVKEGQTFEVTNHGEVVAVLSPAGQARPSLQVRSATERGNFASIDRASITESTASIIDELRGER